MTNDTISIIGGGIGGLTMANALLKAGLPFTLYEQAPKLTEVGAGIGLTQAPIQILDYLGLGEALRDNSIISNRVCFPDKQLNLRREIHFQSETRCIHRAKLIDLLKSNIPKENIKLSKKLTDITSLPDHTVLGFDDGSEIFTSCCIAADGIQSVIRKQLLPKIKTRYIKQTVWRGITEMPTPEKWKNAFLEIWDEGLRYLTIPINETQTLWLAVKRAAPGGKDNPDTVLTDVAELFQNFHPWLQELIVNSDSVIRNDMADLGIQKRKWSVNRVVFIGDAIHATTPNMAQGGCQAIEDAHCLALCLKKYRRDYTTAFKKYYQVRHKKAMNIVAQSWMLGKAAHSVNPLYHYSVRGFLTKSPDAMIRRQERYLNDLSYLEKI